MQDRLQLLDLFEPNKNKIMIHFFTKQIIPDKFVCHFVKIENVFFPLGLSYFERENLSIEFNEN